jgi:hypothetical protein
MEAKRRFTQDLHGVASQKTAFFVRKVNLKQITLDCVGFYDIILPSVFSCVHSENPSLAGEGGKVFSATFLLTGACRNQSFE